MQFHKHYTSVVPTITTTKEWCLRQCGLRHRHKALTKDAIFAILPRSERRYQTDTQNLMMMIATRDKDGGWADGQEGRPLLDLATLRAVFV